MFNIYLSEIEEEEDPEVATADWARNKRVVTCQWVKDFGKEEKYDFDITKANKIFNPLLREKQIHLPTSHVIPSATELGKRKYYKWHNTKSHNTNLVQGFQETDPICHRARKNQFR
jgi:hypothetical protein